jgi:hypothetical protein
LLAAAEKCIQSRKRVSGFRNSHGGPGASFVNFGIEGHWQLIDLVSLWFRNPHDELAASNDADFSTATLAGYSAAW